MTSKVICIRSNKVFFYLLFGCGDAIFHKGMYDIKAIFHEATFMFWRGCTIFKKMFQSFDQITTLTYVLVDNFCPCFFGKS